MTQVVRTMAPAKKSAKAPTKAKGKVTEVKKTAQTKKTKAQALSNKADKAEQKSETGGEKATIIIEAWYTSMLMRIYQVY